MAQLAVRLMRWLGRFPLAQISISVALPYLAYIVAEKLVGASGVIGVVGAGLTLNLAAPGRLSPLAWTNMREVWDLLAHWAGAFIFLLAALLIPRLLDGAQPVDFALVAVVTLAALGARALILWGCCRCWPGFACRRRWSAATGWRSFGAVCGARSPWRWRSP